MSGIGIRTLAAVSLSEVEGQGIVGSDRALDPSDRGRDTSSPRQRLFAARVTAP
jgi:hypothetical protein